MVICQLIFGGISVGDDRKDERIWTSTITAVWQRTENDRCALPDVKLFSKLFDTWLVFKRL